MEADSRGQRKWEEHIYWSHFQSLQFFQTLSGDFDRQLAIPQKFSDNLRAKLSGEVSLKGPSGNLWNVGLTTEEHKVFFKQGWRKFVEDNLLEENDLLIFSYNRDFVFDVLIFDGESFCEKESSYFVKRCGLAEVDNRSKKKDTSPESVAVINESSDENVEFIPPKKRRMKLPTSRSEPQLPRTKGKAQRQNKRVRIAYTVELLSNRRPLTDAEKEKALEMARAALSKDSFMIVMRRTHVYAGFYLSIPCEWARVHLPRKTMHLTLRVKESTWRVRFLRRDYGGGQLVGGWKNFVFENFLEEFDVCVFTLASKPAEDIVLDVSIFRVVDEVIPPSQVGSVYSRGRKVTKYVRGRINEVTGA